MNPIEKLIVALGQAAEQGVLGELSTELPPDRINEFCDAVVRLSDNGMETEGTYVIKAMDLMDDETGEALFWSSSNGWVDRDSATTFNETERVTLRLPMGGQWERVN